MNRIARTSLIGLALATGVVGPAFAYAAPTTASVDGLVRPDEATAREEEPPAPRKICPKRFWPNLAPRCVAEAGSGSLS